MANGPIYKSEVAESIPFDNSANGFVSDNVQAAIEEAKTSGTINIPEYTTDPLSPSINSAWVLKENNGSPIGLLLTLTKDSHNYKFSYKTIDGSIVRTTLT